MGAFQESCGLIFLWIKGNEKEGSDLRNENKVKWGMSISIPRRQQ